ncbi:MAG: trigger factor [Leptospirales bacterium]
MSKITINKISRVKFKATVKPTTEEFAGAETQVFDKVRSGVKLDGFRKGKAPEHIIKSKYAADIADKTLQSLLEIAADQIITENKVALYRISTIDNVKPEKDNYSFDLTYEIEPPIELGKMKNYTLKEDIPVISKSDIEKEVKEVQKVYAQTEIKKPEEGAEKGDMVTMSLEHWDDDLPLGQPQEGVQVILGENQFSEKLELEMISKPAKPGDEFRETVETDVPDENGETKKKNIDNLAKVHAIYKIVYPELNEELFQKHDPDCKTLDQLKKKLEKSMISRFSRKNIAQEINRVVDEIIKDADIEFPENYVEDKFKKYLGENKQHFDQIPDDKLKEIKDLYTGEIRNRLVNDHLMKKATEKLTDYKESFVDYLSTEFDEKTGNIGRQLYESMVEQKQKDEYSGKMLDNLLKYYHYYLLETYFRTQSMVKKNKKIPFEKYMSETKA